MCRSQLVKFLEKMPNMFLFSMFHKICIKKEVCYTANSVCCKLSYIPNRPKSSKGYL